MLIGMIFILFGVALLILAFWVNSVQEELKVVVNHLTLKQGRKE